RAHAAEAAGGITNDPRRPEEIFLEKMVEQILESRRNAVIIFATDHQEPVDAAVQRREAFEMVGRLTCGVFLVHPVEHRQLQLERINQMHDVTAPLELVSYELR